MFPVVSAKSKRLKLSIDKGRTYAWETRLATTDPLAGRPLRSPGR